MNLSNRAINTPASPIRKLFPKAAEATKRGIKIYKLNIGQPDLKTPVCIKKSCQNYSKDLVYEPSPGIPELISTWAKYFETDNLPVTDKDLIITTGGSEAIVFALLATCDPNDEVIVFEPFYTNYKSYAIQTGVKLVPVTLKIEDNFHLPNIEEIAKKITSKTKAILINNPSNPTGTVYKKQELQMIAELALKHNLFIISDEVYNEFVLDKKNKFISMMSFPKVRQQLILIESASKKFNVCGARIGAFISKNQEMIATATKFAQARLSSPSIEQHALITIFKTAKKYTQKICQEYKKRRDVIFEGLKKIKGLTCLKPEGAFYIIAKLPVNDTEKFCAWLLDDFNYKKQTVMLAPAKDFYATENKGLQEVRLAYVLNCKDLKKAMEILKIAIEEYNKK